ncbi:MAG: S41 family peptidase [Planctomycetota bacterium]
MAAAGNPPGMSVVDRTLRTVVVVAALRVATVGCAAAPDDFVADVAGLCQIIADEYAYLDEKLVDWSRVAEAYRGDVEAAGADPVRQLTVIEALLEELYDFHVTLSLANERSPAVVPRDTDLWAEMIGGQAIITAVRPDSPAAVAGLRLGDRVVSIDGTALLDVLDARIGRCGARGDPAAFDWAVVAALAGRGRGDRRIVVRRGVETREVRLLPCPRRAAGGPLVEHQMLPGGIGLIRPRDSLGDNRTIAAFDDALAAVRDSEGLILDLRDTPSGGNTTVARAIMGRLVDTEAAYQRHEAPWEDRRFGVRRAWLELVAPRAAAYRRPVVVLVDRWTASMGEGLAAGLDGLGRATVVGTRMAGLLGGTRGYTLPHSGIVCRFPCEKVYHVNGTPRAEWLPEVLVDLAEAADGDTAWRQAAVTTDPILAAGLRVLALEPVAPR